MQSSKYKEICNNETLEFECIRISDTFFSPLEDPFLIEKKKKRDLKNVVYILKPLDRFSFSKPTALQDDGHIISHCAKRI